MNFCCSIFNINGKYLRNIEDSKDDEIYFVDGFYDKINSKIYIISVNYVNLYMCL